MKHLQKVVLSLIVLTMFIVVPSFTAAAEVDVEAELRKAIILYLGESKAIVQSQQLNIDSKDEKITPVIKDGRTLVPIRFIAESLGANVEYDSKTSKVTIMLNDRKIELVLNSKTMLVNGQKNALDVPAKTENSRTYLPLRAIVEALGQKVFYEQGVIVISETKLDSIIDKTILDKIKEWKKGVPKATETNNKEPKQKVEVPQEIIDEMLALMDAQMKAIDNKDLKGLMETIYFKNETNRQQFKFIYEQFFKMDLKVEQKLEKWEVVEATEISIKMRTVMSFKQIGGTAPYQSQRLTSIGEFIKVDGKWLANGDFPGIIEKQELLK